MAYEKRLCVLKQLKSGFTADGAPIAGAVYAERLGTTLTVTPRIAGLAPLSDGRYGLAVWAGGEIFCMELNGNEAKQIENAPSLSDGFCALVCCLRGDVQPVAFGACGSAPADISLLSEAFAKKTRKDPIPVPLPPNQLPGAPSPQVPLAPGTPVPDEEGEGPLHDAAAAKYDDEAIAAADYFETSQAAQNDALPQDGESASPPLDAFRLAGRGLTYYNEIAPKLKEAFSKYPRDDRLTSSIPHSEWVRTEHALLGVVYAEGTPRYLCVAVESEPPEEAKEASIFVPVSPFDEEKGMYVVFQDADTGDYVKVEAS